MERDDVADLGIDEPAEAAGAEEQDAQVDVSVGQEGEIDISVAGEEIVSVHIDKGHINIRVDEGEVRIARDVVAGLDGAGTAWVTRTETGWSLAAGAGHIDDDITGDVDGYGSSGNPGTKPDEGTIYGARAVSELAEASGLGGDSGTNPDERKPTDYGSSDEDI